MLLDSWMACPSALFREAFPLCSTRNFLMCGRVLTVPLFLVVNVSGVGCPVHSYMAPPTTWNTGNTAVSALFLTSELGTDREHTGNKVGTTGHACLRYLHSRRDPRRSR